MAIGTPALQGSGAGTTTSTTGSFTPPANCRLFALAASKKATDYTAHGSVTDSLGGTWTQVGGNYDGPNSNRWVRATLWYQDIGGSPAAMTVSCTFSPAPETSHITVCSVTSGAPLDMSNLVSAADANGDPSVTLGGTPAAVLNWQVHQTNNAITTTGYTEILDAGFGVSLMRGYICYDLSSPANPCVSSSTNVNCVSISLELKESSASVNATVSQTLDNVTQAASANLPINGTVSTTIDPVVQVASANVLPVNAALAQTIDNIAQDATATVAQPVGGNKGDDASPAHRGVRPIVRIRPKVERDLDDALEIIETIAPEKRVKENKAAAKTALAAIRAVQIPISFHEPVEKIEKALKQLTRKTAKHEGMQQAAMKIAGELEAVIAEMERRRKRRQRDEEAIFWLLN